MSGAAAVKEILDTLAGEPVPLRVRAWDDSIAGPDDAPATVVVRRPLALRRLLWAPHELGLARAYLSGDLDVEGDLYAALGLPMFAARPAKATRPGLRPVLAALRGAAALGALGLPPRRPAEEARLSGLRHSKRRDAEAIAHHYDVSNDFYRVVLGPTMVYSCAYWGDGATTLEAAQTAKLDLVCRKLGLQPGMRVLDVGCGWGSFLIHAATHYDVTGVGVTISQRQYDLATKRVAEAGLADRVEIRLQDYREIADGPYDAISSIGMAEHVGAARLQEYAGRLHALLRPEGRLLNHAIACAPGRRVSRRRSFVWHYVFPDGELLPLGRTIAALELAGLEVRDVEVLREHYSLTLRAWVANLERDWDGAVGLVGEVRARIWHLYMAACARAFDAGRVGVNQVLAVRPGSGGTSAMPLDRHSLVPESRRRAHAAPGLRRKGDSTDRSQEQHRGAA